MLKIIADVIKPIHEKLNDSLGDMAGNPVLSDILNFFAKKIEKSSYTDNLFFGQSIKSSKLL